MEQAEKETEPKIRQRAKGMLVGLRDKAATLFKVSSAEDQEKEIAYRNIADKGRQRLAQTPIGRQLLRWSQPGPKRQRKWRFPIFTTILLALFLVMMLIAFLSSANQ